MGHWTMKHGRQIASRNKSFHSLVFVLTQLHSVEQSSTLCQIWLSNGLPECSTFNYCAWLWNWFIALQCSLGWVEHCWNVGKVHSQAHNTNSPNHWRRKWLSDVVRNDCSINFHLSKLSTVKFSILYDISLVSDWKRKLKLITNFDHSAHF